MGKFKFFMRSPLLMLTAFTSVACSEGFFKEIKTQCSSEYSGQIEKSSACIGGVEIAQKVWKSEWNGAPPSQKESNEALQDALIECRRKYRDPQGSYQERNACDRGVRLVHAAAQELLNGNYFGAPSSKQTRDASISNRPSKRKDSSSHYDQDRFKSFQDGFRGKRAAKSAR